MLTYLKFVVIGVAGGLVLTALSLPGYAAPCAAGQLTGTRALESGWADDKPGLCRQFLPTDLPVPSTSYRNPAHIVPRPHSMRERMPQVPPGFQVRKFRQGE